MFEEFENKTADSETLEKLRHAITESGLEIVEDDDILSMDLSGENGLFEVGVRPVGSNNELLDAFGICVCCGEIMGCGLECD